MYLLQQSHFTRGSQDNTAKGRYEIMQIDSQVVLGVVNVHMDAAVL